MGLQYQGPTCSSHGDSSRFDRSAEWLLSHACCRADAQQKFKPLTLCPQVTRMGLFGLGVPELALVAGAAALLFGKLHACADMIWIFAG